MIQEVIYAPVELKQIQPELDAMREILSYQENKDGMILFLSDNKYISFDNVSLIDETNVDSLPKEDFFWGACESEATPIKNLEVIKSLLIHLVIDLPDEFRFGIQVEFDSLVTSNDEVNQMVSKTPKGFKNCEECEFYNSCGNLIECPYSEY